MGKSDTEMLLQRILYRSQGLYGVWQSGNVKDNQIL